MGFLAGLPLGEYGSIEASHVLSLAKNPVRKSKKQTYLYRNPC
jgi:hypothetical protein